MHLDAKGRLFTPLSESQREQPLAWLWLCACYSDPMRVRISAIGRTSTAALLFFSFIWGRDNVAIDLDLLILRLLSWSGYGDDGHKYLEHSQPYPHRGLSVTFGSAAI